MFSFRVGSNGAIHGSGSGRYVTHTWHETGTVGGTPFTCDAPKTAQPFAVVVGGRLSGGIVHLSLRIPAATEVLHADVDCGLGHKLVAGTTTYLRDSLVAVGGASLQWHRKRSIVLHLAHHADFTAAAAPPTAPGTFHVVQDHAWTVTVKMP
jgi:hypothetical protein